MAVSFVYKRPTAHVFGFRTLVSMSRVELLKIEQIKIYLQVLVLVEHELLNKGNTDKENSPFLCFFSAHSPT